LGYSGHLALLYPQGAGRAALLCTHFIFLMKHGEMKMSITTPKLALGLLFSLTAINAQAALTSYYTAVGNIPVVYSSVSNVTWTQDANLFKTMYDADNSLISQIAGYFQISTGRMSWWGGLAFTHYLNSINYGGSSQWRLPSAGANPQYGYHAGSELGQLFFSELGGTARNSIPNTPTFNNPPVPI
jgi:hypothetical protein